MEDPKITPLPISEIPKENEVSKIQNALVFGLILGMPLKDNQNEDGKK